MGIPAGPAASCYRSGWAWLMEIKITAALSFELSPGLSGVSIYKEEKIPSTGVSK